MGRKLTTQDISWFLDLERKGQLDLDPPYQRRSVWSPRDKRFFIDTILNNYPTPAVFLHKTLDDMGHSTYHVVDGKQRLQTILEFCNNGVRIPDDFGDSTLQKKCWKNLGRETRERFWNYELCVEMLLDVSDSALKDIFDRINRNSRKLTRQELRHAKYDGWFINFVETEAGKPEWREFGVVTNARQKRMTDSQFISELCAVVLRKEMSDFDQDDLDRLYADYEEITENPDFVEDDFIEDVERLKAIISKLMDSEPDIQKYLKIQSHFYTLWAYLNMTGKRYPGTESFAPRYMAFMEAATAAGKSDDGNGAAQPSHAQGVPPSAVRDYAQNILGANTDLVPRKKRLEGLSAAIDELKTLAHENIQGDTRSLHRFAPPL